MAISLKNSPWWIPLLTISSVHQTVVLLRVVPPVRPSHTRARTWSCSLTVVVVVGCLLLTVFTGIFFFCFLSFSHSPPVYAVFFFLFLFHFLSPLFYFSLFFFIAALVLFFNILVFGTPYDIFCIFFFFAFFRFLFLQLLVWRPFSAILILAEDTILIFFGTTVPWHDIFVNRAGTTKRLTFTASASSCGSSWRAGCRLPGCPLNSTCFKSYRYRPAAEGNRCVCVCACLCVNIRNYPGRFQHAWAVPDLGSRTRHNYEKLSRSASYEW